MHVFGADAVNMQAKASEDKLKVSLYGLVSNANYNAKRMVMVLFINGRLVESAPVCSTPTRRLSPKMH
jgi:hypothetical protein